MRRRVLATTLTATALALVLLGVPLGFAVTRLLQGQALSALQREAEQIQVFLNQQGLNIFEQGEVLREAAEESGLRLVLFERRGGLVAVRDTLAPPEVPADLDADLTSALRGEVGRVRADGLLAVSVPVRIGGVSQVLRAVRIDEVLRGEIRGALLAIAALSGVALAVAVGVGTWQAARLSRPLEALADTAAELGRGDFSVRAARSGLPEADRVAEALDATAERLGTLVARTRSLGADASHQLRTPLTALRLDVEALQVAAADDQGALVGAALDEIDRLEATIGELESLAVAPVGTEEVDVGALAQDRVATWGALAAASGRRVVVQAGPVPRVAGRPAALGQALQVLLDNALEHGRGTITVSVATAPAVTPPLPGGVAPPPGAGGHWVRLCVSDEGSGFAPDGVEGHGLVLARSLVEGDGGRLVYDRAPRVCLLLPAAATA